MYMVHFTFYDSPTLCGFQWQSFPGTVSTDKVSTDKASTDKVFTDKVSTDKISTDKVSTDKVSTYVILFLMDTYISCGNQVNWVD